MSPACDWVLRDLFTSQRSCRSQIFGLNLDTIVGNFWYELLERGRTDRKRAALHSLQADTKVRSPVDVKAALSPAAAGAGFM